jgi:hypothetical protein
MRLPRFRFSLGTLFIFVTGLSILLSQWPLVEWAPPQFDVISTGGYGAGGFFESNKAVQIADEYYFVPMRVIAVASVEAAVLIGWLVWRLNRGYRIGQQHSAGARDLLRQNPAMRSPRLQFSLRTVFVAVTVWAVLLTQWPLIEQGPAKYRAEPSEMFDLHSPKEVIDRIYPVWVKIGEGPYYVPSRVVVVASVEAATLLGWLIWRRLQSREALHTT